MITHLRIYQFEQDGVLVQKLQYTKNGGVVWWDVPIVCYK